MKKRVFIDCHTDMQDIPAIKLIRRIPDLEICGISSCYDPYRSGTEEKISEGFLKSSGFEGKISEGARSPIIPRRGCNGGPGGHSEYYCRPQDGYAWEQMCEQAIKDNEDSGITMLLLGPATNLAIAILRYPAIKSRIDHIIMAGGSFGFGDVAPYSERNVYDDAYACKILLHSGIPMTMIGLSAATDAALSRDEMKTAVRCLVGEKKSESCLEDMSLRCLGGKYIVPSLAAVAWMMDPEVAVMDNFHVDVETNGTEMYGRTVIEWRHYLHEPEETRVAISIKKDKLLDIVK